MIDAERSKLIALVQRLIDADYETEAESSADLRTFRAAVPHPEAGDLIFYPDVEFDHEPTAAEIVDRALAYRATPLGPGPVATAE